MKILFLILILNISCLSFAEDYIDFDDGQDSITTNFDHDRKALTVCLVSSKLSDKQCFIREPQYEDSDHMSYSMYIENPVNGIISINEACCGRDTRIYKEYYFFSDEYLDWVNYKFVTFNSLYSEQPELGLTDENMSVKEIDISPTLVGKNTVTLTIEQRDIINSRLNKLYSEKMDTALENKSKDISFMQIIDMMEYLPMNENISKYNDLAYYLSKGHSSDDDYMFNITVAIYLYNKVISTDPSRTVAYFNLADSLDALGEKDKALTNYKIYVEQMTENGKAAKIPQRVTDYIKTHSVSETTPKAVPQKSLLDEVTAVAEAVSRPVPNEQTTSTSEDKR